MAGRFVLALDAGGGGGGALVLDLESGAAWTAHRPWRHAIAPGTGGWGYDFDCRGAWRALVEAAREAIAAAGCEPSAIAGLATTAMRHGTVLIDAGGREIFATPNRDARAAGQATGLASEHGADVYAKTGLWPAPLLPLARLKWLAEEQPALMAEASAALSISDWLTFRLTGETVSELTQAQSGGLVEVASGETIDTGLAQLAGVPPELFPRLVTPGTRTGSLSNAAADALGIPEGTPVFAAPADTQAALFGSGVVDRGLVAVAGTTLPVVAVTASPALDPNRRTWTGLAGSPGRWMVESNAGPAGEALEMLAGMFFPGERLAVARFAAEAASVGPCAGGVLSDLGASLFNASGLALPAGAVGLSPLVLAKADSARAVVARATLEGIAFAVRANIEQIEDVTGPIDGPLAVCGACRGRTHGCRSSRTPRDAR